MQCEKCGAELSSGAAFCQNCGQPVKNGAVHCVSCGKELPDGATFCPFCGEGQVNGKKAKKSKKKKKWPFIVGAILLALIILFSLIPGEESTNSNKPEINPNKSPKATEEPVKTPEPTPDRYTYRSDGQYDTYLDDDGNKWEYLYTDDGIFRYRVKTIKFPAWHMSEEPQTFSGFTVYPCEFDEPVENCIGFDVSYTITHVDYGSVYGQYVIYVLEPEISSSKYQDEGRIEVKENETATKTVEFSKPRTVSSLALRQYIADMGGSSWNAQTQITNLKILDYNYE